MDEVVDAHLDARAAHGDVIGALVVPVSRLSELVADLVRRRPAAPVAVSLSVDTGLGGVPKAFSLTSSRPALLAPVTVEMPAPHDVDGTWLERVTEFVPDDVVAVVEPRRPDTPSPGGVVGPRGAEVSSDWLEGVRRVVAHGCRPKLRCGGGRAGAFPRDDDVAGFLAVVLGAGRPFTASIGLQRAVRHVEASTGVTHHGWLNILVATARLLTAPPGGGGAPDDPDAHVVATLTEALTDTDPEALAAELDALDPVTAARTRELFPSFGSTDLREAGTEMTRLGLVGSS